MNLAILPHLRKSLEVNLLVLGSGIPDKMSILWDQALY
jgi:hypothetical protein